MVIARSRSACGRVSPAGGAFDLGSGDGLDLAAGDAPDFAARDLSSGPPDLGPLTLDGAGTAWAIDLNHGGTMRKIADHPPRRASARLRLR